jgi:hypothetical protein
MVSKLHEAPATWLGEKVGQINEHLQQVCLCAPVTVATSGAASIDMEGSGYKAPDGSLHPCLRDEHGHVTRYLQTRPVVVLETAASQSLKSVMKKAIAHLFRTNNETKAVIICNLTHPVPANPRTYRAEISVWVRQLTGDVGMVNPMLLCSNADERILRSGLPAGAMLAARGRWPASGSH